MFDIRDFGRLGFSALYNGPMYEMHVLAKARTIEHFRSGCRGMYEGIWMTSTTQTVILQKTVRSLEANSFEVKVADDAEEATRLVLSMIPKGASVGIGDSATIRQIGLLEALAKRRVKVVNPFSKELSTDPRKRAIAKRVRMLRKALVTDVFITSSNAITMDGKLVNIDAVGNRVAAMIFGPKRTIIIVGVNKLVENVDAAIHRIKNTIAPTHTRTKKITTPCAATGECSDCHSPDRICSVTSIIERRPWRSTVMIVIVKADFGLSYDPTWEQARKDRILSAYQASTWRFPKSTLRLSKA